MREIEPSELSARDGAKGESWVAAHGSVYDVSGSRLWKKGRHVNRHQAGADLTAALSAAPHGPEILERVPKVGVLAGAKADAGAAAPAESALPGPVAGLLAAVPFLRRHPHPLLVHFPVALAYVGALLAALWLLFGGAELAAAARVTAVGCGIAAVPALASGFWAWWVAWGLAPIAAVRIKIAAGLVFTVLAAACAAWWLAAPDLLTARDGRTWALAALLGGQALLVSVLGWFGATLTIRD